MENNQQNSNASNYGLYQVAYIFMILSCVLLALALVPLAWLIPMTLATKNCRDQAGKPEETSHVALGVCSLLFANMISGILILVASSSSPKK